ncbi:response regulator transcription factor [Streptomyces sp. ISL-94]|nr:response regulator transcription factor [Streptomyces sp. ISL-94]
MLRAPAPGHRVARQCCPRRSRRLLRDHVAGGSGQDTRAAAARARLDLLAEREREVALAVGRGLSNAEIARELHLALPAVKTHVSRILTGTPAGGSETLAAWP